MSDQAYFAATCIITSLRDSREWFPPEFDVHVEPTGVVKVFAGDFVFAAFSSFHSIEVTDLEASSNRHITHILERRRAAAKLFAKMSEAPS